MAIHEPTLDSAGLPQPIFLLAIMDVKFKHIQKTLIYSHKCITGVLVWLSYRILNTGSDGIVKDLAFFFLFRLRGVLF